MTTQVTRVAEKAKADRKLRFTSLAHLLTPQFFAETWRMGNKKGAPGVDGEPVEPDHGFLIKKGLLLGEIEAT